MTLQTTLLKFLLVAGLSLAGNWIAVPADAKISFSVKGPFGTVHGNFSGLQATIKFAENELESSSVSASVDAASVSTGIGLRNRDLRKKEEWLHTDKYPRISFRSGKIEKTGNGFSAIGDLTIKGITRPAVIPFTFAADGNKGVFKGQFNIRREDFTIGRPGGSVGSVITLMLEIPVNKQ